MNVRSAVAVAFVVAVSPVRTPASWIQFELPSLSQAFGGTALSHLPDGRYVFAETGHFYVQDGWGAAGTTALSGVPSGMDPSFIAVRDSSLAAAGAGGWGSSAVYTFDPSSPSTPAFTDVGVTLQNFQGVFRDGTSLFTSGSDTGSGGDHNGIRYIALSGGLNKIVVDDVSVYSAGLAIDEAGNLYVGNNDDGGVYRFTKSQLDGAIAGSALAIADGELIYDFGGGGDIGSLAVDAEGRIWAAGWLHNGLRVYDPALGQEFTYVPGLDNANYKVASFSRGGTNFVAYLNQANPYSGGTQQFYGYEETSLLAVPEPGTIGLFALGTVVAGGVAARRRRA